MQIVLIKKERELIELMISSGHLWMNSSKANDMSQQ